MALSKLTLVDNLQRDFVHNPEVCIYGLNIAACHGVVTLGQLHARSAAKWAAVKPLAVSLHPTAMNTVDSAPLLWAFRRGDQYMSRNVHYG